MAGEKRLTVKAIEAYLKGGIQTPLHDGGGLYLRKRAAGAYWYLRQATSDGGRTWVALFPPGPSASFPHRSLEEARRAAAEARVKKDESGQDLNTLRRQQQAEDDKRAQEEALARSRAVTVKDLAVQWKAIELKTHITADGVRSGRKDEGKEAMALLERWVFPKIGDRVAREVTRADVLSALDSIRAAGHLRTANIALQLTKQLFRFALVRELVDRNPTDTLTKRDAGGREVSRERVLSVDELATLFKAIGDANLAPRARLAVPLALATCVRAGELAGAVWNADDLDRPSLLALSNEADVKLGVIDLAKRTWHLLESKSDRPHTIWLSDFAIEILKEMKKHPVKTEDGKTSRWIFARPDGLAPLGPTAIGKQLMDRQAGNVWRKRSAKSTAIALPGGRWTMHDLRRTGATLMAVDGTASEVIDACLNHVVGTSLQQTYIRDRREHAQRTAFESLGARLSKLYDDNAS